MTLSTNQMVGDYVIQVNSWSVNGAENPYEIGLGIYLNDATFPFFLVPSKFGKYVAHRV